METRFFSWFPYIKFHNFTPLPHLENMTKSNPQRQGEQKKPLAPHEVRLIRGILEAEKNLRDLALFNTAIDIPC